MKFSRRDYLLIGLLMVLYGGIALYNLGSMKGPRTFWSVSGQQKVIIDFGQEQEVRRIYLYGLFKDATFAIESSNDLTGWEPSNLVTISNTFTWDFMEVSFKARYVRLTITTVAGRIFEMAFFGQGREHPLPISFTSCDPASPGDDSPVTRMFDEQDTACYCPTFKNSMYFDEIYHARTAYEHLHRIEPYESTHPPLGKLFISLGMALFGMNPFGWRIAGTICGIFMISLMYILGMAVFKKTRYAFLAAFLMTFDFIHFSQTRIATIDSYSVFFIILMYYFMLRYYELNFYTERFGKTLVPLGLSGLFFGLGVASKWNCVYAGAGLAVILAISFHERYREFRRFGKERARASRKRIADGGKADYGEFPVLMGKTILWCCLFFIIIPGIVYLLSYIPFMMVPGPGHGIKDVITYQKHIYHYHKTLKATHPFSSPWWSWPVMTKPIWLYSGDAYLPEDKVMSIVTMGNPAVWWTGIAAVLITMGLVYRRKDRLMLLILIALAFQYAPWMLVPRLTFIYHFFPSVPFVIICIVYVLSYLEETSWTWGRTLTYGYLALVFFLFVLFYPILSGMVVSKSYVLHFLRWLPGWYFCR